MCQVLLDHSHSHLLTCRLWLPSCYNSRHEGLCFRPYSPESKTCTILSHKRILLTPVLESRSPNDPANPNPPGIIFPLSCRETPTGKINPQRSCAEGETDLGRPWAPESSSTPRFPSYFTHSTFGGKVFLWLATR